MQFRSIFRILGVLLTIFSGAMLPPIVIALIFKDGAIMPFLVAFIVTFLTGVILWSLCRHSHKDLRTRDGFLVVVLFWTVLSSFGAIPFAIGDHPNLSLTEAIFESVSGLTATGMNVIAGLDYLPHSILFYRQQLHFLGGMGIIVLAIAILPMLGIGGMQLYRAETPGPVKDYKLTPRLAETAKALWYIYVGLTISCLIAFHTAGMSWFDAIGESFSVVSTGGFSTHDASFMHYNNFNLDIIAIIFMVLGGTNFALHYQFIRYGRIKSYWSDTEWRSYLLILFVVSIIAAITLYWHQIYPDLKTDIIKGTFIVVSIATTTGLTNADFSHWPSFLPYLIVMLALIGGCAASTSGGVKVIRAVLMQRQGLREIKQLIHPRAIIPVKINNQVLPPHVIQSIWAFMAVFIMLYMLLNILMLATGLDFTTAFAAVTAAQTNMGAGIGAVADDFNNITAFGKWVLIFGMLAGRLEIFSLLVLFSRSFWRE